MTKAPLCYSNGTRTMKTQKGPIHTLNQPNTFKGKKLIGADLRGMDLSGTGFERADSLEGVKIAGAKFSKDNVRLNFNQSWNISMHWTSWEDAWDEPVFLDGVKMTTRALLAMMGVNAKCEGAGLFR